MGPPVGTSPGYGWQAVAAAGVAELFTVAVLRHVPPPHVALERHAAFGVAPPKHLLGWTKPSAPLSTPGTAQFAT